MSYVKEVNGYKIFKGTPQDSVRESEKQEEIRIPRKRKIVVTQGQDWADTAVENYLRLITEDPNYRENILRKEFERMLNDPDTRYRDLLEAMDFLGKSSFDIGKHRLVLFPNG